MLLFLCSLSKPEFVPQNGEFVRQFYIRNTGQNNGIPSEDINILRSWNNGFTGKNVFIDVFATECDDRTDALRERVLSNCSSPEIFSSEKCFERSNDGSGTYVGGIIAGRANTSRQIGVAFDSSLRCFPFVSKITEMPTKKMLMNALTNSVESGVKVIPLSSECSENGCEADQYIYDEEMNLTTTFFSARGGLGEIVVMSPAAYRGKGVDPNFRFLTSTRFPINVAASTNRGNKAYYSPTSANLLINVPSSDSVNVYTKDIVTNPVMPMNETKNGVSVNKMSSAAAIAAGGIAVIMQAYPFIRWRNMQLLLALSSTINDANHSSWKKNAAGIKYSRVFGFGRLNVDRAIEINKMLPDLPFENKIISSRTLSMINIPSCRADPLEIEHHIKGDIGFIENVQVIIKTTHKSIGDVVLTLTSPQGTTATVVGGAPIADSENEKSYYAFNCRQFLGESAKGKWIIKVSALGCGPTGRIIKTQVVVFGVKKYECQGLKYILNRKIEDESINSMIREDESIDNMTKNDEHLHNMTREDEPFNNMTREDEPFNNITREDEPFNNMTREDEPFNNMTKGDDNDDEHGDDDNEGDHDKGSDSGQSNGNKPFNQIMKEEKYCPYKPYPNSELLTLSINVNKDRMLNAGEIVKFHISSDDQGLLYRKASLFVLINSMPYPVTLKVFNEAIDIEEYEHTIPCLSQKKSNITYYVEIYNNSTVFSARCGPLYIKGSNFSTNQYEVLHKNTVINQVYNLNYSNNSEFVFLSIIDVDNNEIVEKKLIPNIGIAQITLSESYNFNRGIITVQSINTVEPANSYDVACDMFIKAFYLEKKTTPILFNTSKCSNITNLQYQSKEADIPYTMIFTPTEIPTFVVLNNDTTTLDSQETKEVETDPVVIVAIVSSLIVIALVGALVTIIKIRKNKAREVTEYFEADADTKETDFSQISVI